MKRAVFVAGLPETGKTALCRALLERCTFLGYVELDRMMYHCCDVGFTERMLLHLEAHKFSALAKKVDVWKLQADLFRMEYERRPYDCVLLDGYQFLFGNFASFYMRLLREYGFEDFAMFIRGECGPQGKDHPLRDCLIRAGAILPEIPSGLGRYQGYWFNAGESHSRTAMKLDHLKIPDLTMRSVLDVGCNEGFFSLYAASRGAKNVLGIDTDAGCLSDARKIHAELMSDFSVRFIDGDALAPNVLGRYGSFDVAFMLSVLHYSQDWSVTLRSICDAITEVLVLEVPVLPGGETVYRTIDGGQWVATEGFLDLMLSGMFARVEYQGETVAPRYPSDWNEQQVILFRKMRRVVYHCWK